MENQARIIYNTTTKVILTVIEHLEDNTTTFKTHDTKGNERLKITGLCSLHYSDFVAQGYDVTKLIDYMDFHNIEIPA
jgi:hypothetical protein